MSTPIYCRFPVRRSSQWELRCVRTVRALRVNVTVTVLTRAELLDEVTRITGIQIFRIHQLSIGIYFQAGSHILYKRTRGGDVEIDQAVSFVEREDQF